MEDFVNFPGFWQFQLVSHWSKYLFDFKRSFLFGCHLLVIICLQVSGVQPYHLSFFEWSDFICSAIRLLASSCAANASSLLVTRFFIFSATDGNLVFLKLVGIASGASSCMSSKEVCVLSACCQLLWVSSSVDNEFFHSVDEQSNRSTNRPLSLD